VSFYNPRKTTPGTFDWRRLSPVMATIVAVVVIPYLVVMAAAWLFQRHLIYQPFGEVAPPSAVGLAGVDEVVLSTDDGLTLHAWFVPAAASGNGWTILHFNGNAGTRAHRAPLSAALALQGIASLLFDYRGYGGNAGSPSEEGLARDARAAHRYLSTRPGVDAGRIVYFGESLGSGVALRQAIETPPAALVLRSPFTSITDVAGHFYPFLPVRWLVADRFASVDRVKDLRSRLLIIAGDADSIIPFSMSERLYAAAPEPKRFVRVEGADHNDAALLDGQKTTELVTAFLRSGDR
jgi:uncharacterized protein